MSWLRPHLRRAPGQPARGLPSRDALGPHPRGLGLPGLRGARQARLREAARRLGRALPVLLLLPGFAGCAALKLTYNNLDWLAEWQVRKFVDLERPQKALFEERFNDFWGWHSGTQLSLYAQDLRELRAAADRPLSAAQVESWLERATAHMARAMQGAVPDLARVLRTLDDGQVAELVANLAKRREKSREESRELTREDLVERAEEQMHKNLKRWIGGLDRNQRRRLRDWALEREYAGTIWHQYQEAWAAGFTRLLEARRDPDFAHRLSVFFDGGKVPHGAEMEQVQQRNRRLLIGLLADLSASLDARQRAHFRERLEDLAADLEDLARQGRPQAAPASPIG
jgi:hypothetical protein